MPVVYVGTAPFAAALLRSLAGGPWRPALVISRPDAKQGRGRRTAPPAVALAAAELGIPLLQPDDINDAATAAAVDAAAGPDGAVVLCAFGALISGPLLTGREIVNVHPSLLPRWRGAAPIERAIIAGDEQTGVSLMRLVPELDAGPVYIQRPVVIESGDDFGTLSARLEQLAVELLTETLAQQPLPAPVPQPLTGITYADKIVAADRTLDPVRPAIERERVVRALRPHIGARIELKDGTMLGVLDARARDDGTLELLRVQPPGGRPMDYADYLRGHGPVPGY